jgi:predicted  nucleic acid-binding Zn-ribbon protein
MAAAPTEFHVHVHIPGLVDHTAQLNRMEQLMATAAEQINALSDKIDAQGVEIADIKGDFTALLEAMNAERENLTPAGQAALDTANAKADANAADLGDLDEQVGEHDGVNPPAEEPVTEPEA